MRKFDYVRKIITITLFFIWPWSLFAVELEVLETYLNSQNISHFDKDYIIPQLLPITQHLTFDQWQKFTLGTNAFITPCMKSDEKTLVMTATINAPLETINDSLCIDAVQNLIPQHIKGIELTYFIAVLINTPAETLKHPSFTKTVDAFIPSESPHHAGILVTKTIGEVPLKKLRNSSFIPTVKALTPTIVSDDILSSIIAIVAKMEEKNWDNFQRVVNSLISHEMNHDQRLAIMRAFAAIPAEKFTQPSFSHAIFCFTHSMMTPEDLNYIIQALALIPEDVLQEPSFLETVHSFINSNMPVNELIFILKTFATVPIEIFKDPSFIPVTTSFLHSRMTIPEQMAIVKAFAGISTKHLDTFKNLLMDLKVLEMDHQYRAFIIERVAKIAPEKWADLEIAIYAFSTREMQIHEHIDIILSFARVPAENWEDFKTAINTIIRLHMSNDKRVAIIKTFSTLPAEKFRNSSFIKTTLAFLIPGLTGDDCSQIIQTTASLPNKILDEPTFVEIVNAFTSSKMSTLQRMTLIKTLATVPIEKLKNPSFTTTTRAFLAPHLTIDDWCHFIEATSSLSERVLEEPSFTKEAPALITQDMNVIQRITILKIFEKLPIDHWKILNKLLSDLKTIKMDQTEQMVIIIKTGGLLIDHLFPPLLARPDFIEKSIEDRITGINILSSISILKQKTFFETIDQLAGKALRTATPFDILDIFKKAETHIDERDLSKILYFNHPRSSTSMEVDNDL